MHRVVLAAAIVGIGLAAYTAPSQAAYGAFALDEAARKYGDSWNKESQQEADEAALKGCGTDKCKIVFRTGPKQCGAVAVAVATDSKVWGGAQRDQRQAAELAAVENCQKRTTGQCKVRASQCNR